MTEAQYTADRPMEPTVIPEEVRRLRLEPGDRLVARIRDIWTLQQIQYYRESLQAHFPDNEVLGVIGEEITVAPVAPEPQWATAEVSGTGLSDDDINRIVERISKLLRGLLPAGGGVRTAPR